MNTEIHIREYERADRNRCVELAREAWPVAADPKGLMEVYVDLALAASTRALVAVKHGQVVGLILGRLESEMRQRKTLAAADSVGRIAFRYFAGSYPGVRRKVGLALSLLRHERLVGRWITKHDSEVTLFVVAEAARGQGVGKLLMNTLVDVARAQSQSRLKLYTDEACTWQFYEAYGFQRLSQFPDRLFNFVSDRNVLGFVYSYDFTPEIVPSST